MLSQNFLVHLIFEVAALQSDTNLNHRAAVLESTELMQLADPNRQCFVQVFSFEVMD